MSAVADLFDDVVAGLRVVGGTDDGSAEDGSGLDVDMHEFACLSGRERDQALMRVEREFRRLGAQRAAMVRRVETSKSFADDGHLSVRGWFGAVTNSTTESASREVRVGRMLADMPLLAAAYERGDVGSDQLRILARLHANARCRSKMADSDGLLTGHAIRLHIDDFIVVARRWMAWADPDGRDPEAAHRDRDANIRPVGAGFSLRARGSGIDGEVIAEVFAQFVEAERLTDIAARQAEFGDDAANHPLPRTPAQRRADAFMQMVLKSAEVVSPTSREPLINLFCTPEELAAAIRNHADPDSRVPDWLAQCDAGVGDVDEYVDPHEPDEPGQTGVDLHNHDGQNLGNDASPTPTDPTETGAVAGTPAVTPGTAERGFADGADGGDGGDAACDPDGADRYDAGEPGEAAVSAAGSDARNPCATESTAAAVPPLSRGGAECRSSVDTPLPSAGMWPYLNGRGRLCETAGGAPVDHHTLLTAALIGQIRRVITDSTGRVLDLGRRQRLFTGATREAVLLASERCCWPGCGIRGPGVQVDHLTEHHAGGHTSVFNGAPMCPLHNRIKHRHRVSVHRDATGWHFHRPDATEITPRPG